jgi:S1-C subfamily serine protease
MPLQSLKVGAADLFLLAVCLVSLGAQPPAREDLAGAEEQAMAAAVMRVAPSVVQIETSGGTDVIGSGREQIRKGTGPTTGLVVTTDGYIISSAFNFANKPAAVFVALPGHKDRYVAQTVATDQTRMLTLLKIEASGLPLPMAAPKSDMHVGQSALALGRTWTGPDGAPSVSVGIVSALGRIWGKAIQTDAKVSPVNYGGPLVDIQGRVLGVLVPASPRAQDETAGVEWYDSGIGFAIPLEDINAVLPRLKKGKDLKRGLLGVVPKNPPEKYNALPEIASVLPESAAAHAGLRPGDVITEVAGVKVERQAQVLHVIGNKYEGDVVSLKVRRGKEEINLKDLRLTGSLAAFAHGFLGILPMRDDAQPGVEVRFVYPKSPADKAGIKPGDRILKAGRENEPLKSFAGRDALLALLNDAIEGSDVSFEVRRKDVKDMLKPTTKLAAFPDFVPDDLPEPASFKKALATSKAGGVPPPLVPKPEIRKEPAKKPEVGLLKRTNAAGDHEYWAYIPENYDPNISHALVIWLHPAGKVIDKDVEAMVNIWGAHCANKHLILVGPKAQNESGWLASEADVVLEAVQEIMAQYTIDRQRVVAHGMAKGGQMAFYLGFHSRDVVRGVAVTGATLAGHPAEDVQRLSFFVVAGGNDPLRESIADSKRTLAARKLPVIYREIADMGAEYLDAPTLKEIVRWIDSLDRM